MIVKKFLDGFGLIYFDLKNYINRIYQNSNLYDSKSLINIERIKGIKIFRKFRKANAVNNYINENSNMKNALKIITDKNLFIKLTSFTGWNLLGNVTNIFTQNGVVFLINIFYGVGLNAALGIANQVNSAVTSFISGFQTSFVPQIVKLHSQSKTNLSKMLIQTY